MIPIRFDAVPVAPFLHPPARACDAHELRVQVVVRGAHTAELSMSIFAVRSAIKMTANEREQARHGRGPRNYNTRGSRNISAQPHP